MPVTNPPALSSIRTEFQGPNNFKPYVRNGAHVPTNSTTGAISTTEAGLAMSQFANAQKTVASTPLINPSPNPAHGYSQGQTFQQDCGRTIDLFPSGGNGTYTYTATLVNYAGGTNPAITFNTANNTAVGWLRLNAGINNTATGWVEYDIYATSGGMYSNTVRVRFNLEYYHENPNCVVVRSIICQDMGRAGDIDEGDTLLVTDPFAEHPVAEFAIVRGSSRAEVPCVRILTEGGAWLECSYNAPIPIEKGDYARGTHLRGERIPVATRDALSQKNIEFEWQEVVKVEDIGLQEVQNLFVDHQNFWASADGKQFILHHNGKIIM